MSRSPKFPPGDAGKILKQAVENGAEVTMGSKHFQVRKDGRLIAVVSQSRRTPGHRNLLNMKATLKREGLL